MLKSGTSSSPSAVVAAAAVLVVVVGIVVVAAVVGVGVGVAVGMLSCQDKRVSIYDEDEDGINSRLLQTIVLFIVVEHNNSSSRSPCSYILYICTIRTWHNWLLLLLS